MNARTRAVLIAGCLALGSATLVSATLVSATLAVSGCIGGMVERAVARGVRRGVEKGVERAVEKTLEKAMTSLVERQLSAWLEKTLQAMIAQQREIITSSAAPSTLELPPGAKVGQHATWRLKVVGPLEAGKREEAIMMLVGLAIVGRLL